MKTFKSHLVQIILAILVLVAASCSPTYKSITAASKGDKAYFEKITSKDALDVQDKSGVTALMIACRHRNKELVSLLLSKGADPNLKDKKLNTALLDNKANVNFYANDFASPASIAAENMNPGILDLLVLSGCTLNLNSDPGFYPIKMAVGKKCDEVIINLLFDCETNYATASSLLEKKKTTHGDSLKCLDTETEKYLKLSLDEINKRKGEYNRKIASKVAGNIGSALLTTALNIGTVAANTENVNISFDYHWDSNEFNRAVLKTLQRRTEFVEGNIASLQQQ